MQAMKNSAKNITKNQEKRLTLAGAELTFALPPPNPCNGTALRKATRRVSQLYDAVLAPCGLRSTQRSMLIYIARLKTPTMGDLAAALVLDRSALAHNLKPLERDGLVAIEPDPQDRRSRLVTLTKRGEARLAQSMSLWRDAQVRFENVFGAEKAEALRDVLAIVASDDFAKAFEKAGRSKGAKG
jgi:DNA-binding MarR family transcriptional regulator